jgi:hypothetical protein
MDFRSLAHFLLPFFLYKASFILFLVYIVCVFVFLYTIPHLESMFYISLYAHTSLVIVCYFRHMWMITALRGSSVTALVVVNLTRRSIP